VIGILALLRGDGLKGGNLLPYRGAFALRALDLSLFILGKRHGEGKGLLALLTDKFIYRHAHSPLYEII
jgi:hypothetical protein